MQELDAALQMAVRIRTELWSMIADLPESKLFSAIEIPLTFYENGHVIAWGDDSECFSPATFRFVLQLWIAPDRTLSKEDVRQDVQMDNESKSGSIWTCISRVRQELKSVEFPYEIETLRGKGYRLTKT